MTASAHRVVVLFGSSKLASSGSSLSTEASRLHALLRDHPEVTVITRGSGRTFPGSRHIDLASAPPSLLDRAIGRFGGDRLLARFRMFPLGRLLISLSPLDEGRVFWRSIKASADAREILRGADVAIAADAAGVKTAWLARRRSWVKSAFYDHRAGGFGATFQAPTEPLDQSGEGG